MSDYHKLISLFYLIFYLFFFSCTHRPEVTDEWPDGTPQRSEKILKSGHSVEYSYYPNGKLEFKATYFNDMLDGKSEYWDENGHLKSVSTYSAEKLHGLWLQYKTDDRVIHSVEYFHGQKHGLEIWYWDNGQKKSEQRFEFDHPATDIRRWDSGGKPMN
ncbi:MAG: hypothetical protein HQ510_02010 [Candidatus Marinimicrobia bacterium]|nr:hypothetical protein [Candidatus Neomarinimicrobiota bacterium]